SGLVICRHVTGLWLDDGKRGELAAGLLDVGTGDDAVIIAKLRRALEKSRVETEDVTGKCFTSRWTTQHERKLSIRSRLLREIIVHAQSRLSFVVHEVLGHRATGVRRDVLHRRGRGCACDDDDGV